MLWVDDQPGNNAGLQYAFEALGIVVITVEDTDRIDEAFDATGGFDVAITDMSRDAVRGKELQTEAGLKTVDLIRDKHRGIPVIIYSGSYAGKHDKDPLVAPVKAITNNPETVFTIVTELAKQKGA